MPAEANSTIELLSKNYQFYVFLFSMFVICMGVARWVAKQASHERAKESRKKLGLPVVSLVSAGGGTEQSFTYSSLFGGGLWGLYVVSVSLSWVVLMTAFDWGPPLVAHDEIPQERILHAIPTLMGYPIFMLLFVSLVIAFSPKQRRNFGPPVPAARWQVLAIALFAISFVGTLFALPFYYELETSQSIVLEIILTVIESLCLSCAIGITEGLKAADPALNYPLVTVELLQGKTIDRAWLYERTDSDYRLVAISGSNHIIPAANVKQIKGPFDLKSLANFGGTK